MILESLTLLDTPGAGFGLRLGKKQRQLCNNSLRNMLKNITGFILQSRPESRSTRRHAV